MKHLVFLIILISCSKNIKELININKVGEKYWDYIREDRAKDLEEYLETNKIDFDETNKEGETVLTLAVKSNSSNVIKFLLRNEKINIDINNKNNKSQNALISLIMFNDNFNGIAGAKRYNIIDELLKKDIDINSRYGIGNNNTLMLAINKGDIHLARKILEKDIDINAQNFKKETALMLLIKNGVIEASKMEILAKKDLKLNVKDNLGNTALIYSVINDSNNICKKLLEEKEIDIYLKNNKGKNAINYILKKCNKDLIDVINKKFYNSKNLFLNIFLDNDCLNNFFKYPKEEIENSLNLLQVEKHYIIKYILNHFYNEDMSKEDIRLNLDYIIETFEYGSFETESDNKSLDELIKLSEKYIEIGKYDLISSLISKLSIFNYIFLNNNKIINNLKSNQNLIKNAIEFLLNSKKTEYKHLQNLILKNNEKENFVEFVLKNINYEKENLKKLGKSNAGNKENIENFLDYLIEILDNYQFKLKEVKKVNCKSLLKKIISEMLDVTRKGRSYLSYFLFQKNFFNFIESEINSEKSIYTILKNILSMSYYKSENIDNCLKNFLEKNPHYKLYNSVSSKELINQFSIEYLKLFKKDKLLNKFEKSHFNLMSLNHLLVLSIRLNFEDLFFELIQNYSNSIINLIDDKENNLLHHAIKTENNKFMVYILKNNKQLLFKKNIKNESPIYKILKRENNLEKKLKMIKVCLENIGNIEIYDKGYHILFKVVEEDKIELVNFLMQNFQLNFDNDTRNGNEENLISCLINNLIKIFEKSEQETYFNNYENFTLLVQKANIYTEVLNFLIKNNVKVEENESLVKFLEEIKNKNSSISYLLKKEYKDFFRIIENEMNSNYPIFFKKNLKNSQENNSILKEEIFLEKLINLNYKILDKTLKFKYEIELSELIINFNNINWTYVNEEGFSLILEFVRAGYSKIIIKNIHSMKYIDKITTVVDLNGDNLLFVAIEINDLKFLKFLIKSKYIKFDQKFIFTNKDGDTPLMFALKINNIIAADFILSENRELDMLYWRNKDGFSAIDLALKNNEMYNSLEYLEIESKIITEKIAKRKNFDTSNYWNLKESERLGILQTVENNLKEEAKINEIKCNSLLLAAENGLINTAKKLMKNLPLKILVKAFLSCKSETAKRIIVKKIRSINPRFKTRKIEKLRKEFLLREISSEDIYLGLEIKNWSLKGFMNKYTINDEKIANINLQKIENKSKKIKNKKKVKEYKNKFRKNNNKNNNIINQPQKR